MPGMEMESEEPMPATIEASVESLGGAKVGQKITLTVESIDEESGMATLVPSSSATATKPSSIEEASDEFEEMD